MQYSTRSRYLSSWLHQFSWPRFHWVSRLITWVSVGLVVVSLNISSALAAPTADRADLLRQPPIEVQVSLGNTANELTFIPNHLEFVAGKRYKLVLNNPSNQKHYFTAKDFADGIWSQKVEAGNVEIKGAIHELELKPGAQAEWVFVPLKSGTYQLRCPIAGHSEAGMTGLLTIATSPPQA